MSNLQEAIETCTDMLDVINNCGSAYLYKHNGGDKKLEKIITELSRIRALEAAATTATEAMTEMVFWHGKNLQVYGWHENGAPEPLDNIICDSGLSEAIDALTAAREGRE